MAVASRCCFLWGKKDEQEPLQTSPVKVADRVKSINAKGGAGPGPNLGERVRSAAAQAPKPTPSLARQIGGAPPKAASSLASPQSSEQAPPLKSPSPAAPKSPQVTVQTRPQPSTPRQPEAQASPRPAGASGNVSKSAAGPSSALEHKIVDQEPPEVKTSATVIAGSSLEEEVLQWVEAVSGETKGPQSLMAWLKDGQVLCRTVNKVQQGICPRINSQSMPFKQMENVTAFIQACRKLGVLEKDVFSTVDLYEGKNPKAVMNCIASLGAVIRRTAPSFRGPYIGVAQNSTVADAARAKTAVTQDSGFRTDITQEVRAGVSKGRRV